MWKKKWGGTDNVDYIDDIKENLTVLITEIINYKIKIKIRGS